MERLAARLAESISGAMHYDQDKQEVIAYGLIGLFQILVIAAAITVIGLLADFWYEAVLIFLGVGLLRKCMGGVHAQTLLGCTVISIVSISALSALCRYLLLSVPVSVAVPAAVVLTGCCFWIAFRKVPVDTPNKPITRPEKRKRLRRQSFVTIAIYGAVCVSLACFSVYHPRLLSLSYAVLCALLWQTFTLTGAGAAAVHMLDALLEKR